MTREEKKKLKQQKKLEKKKIKEQKKAAKLEKKLKKDKNKVNNEKPKKQPTNIYYLTMREENGKKVGWEIKRGNAAKVSAVVKTKEQAKNKVKELAKSTSATVIIYKMDGTIEETYKINEK